MTQQTELITDPNVLQVFTATRKTDAHSAIVRGITEYLAGLRAETVDGKLLKFERVLEDWADLEQDHKFLTAAVYTQEPGIYDDSSFSGSVHVTPENARLRVVSNMTQLVTIEVMCTSRAERVAVAMMLEDALDPVDWMTGARLLLPHYHGAHMTLLKESMDYGDSEDKARKRWRMIQLQVMASIPQVRFDGVVPALDIRTRVEVTE